MLNASFCFILCRCGLWPSLLSPAGSADLAVFSIQSLALVSHDSNDESARENMCEFCCLLSGFPSSHAFGRACRHIVAYGHGSKRDADLAEYGRPLSVQVAGA